MGALLQAHLRDMWTRQYWIHRWWRICTVLRLMRPTVRREVHALFHAHPSLCHARRYGDAAAMAGFYNDHVAGGFMTPRQARRIYAKGQA